MNTVQDKINILLIDDQPSKLLSYGLILGELGENLVGAASPREAFEHLLRMEIAVILMDVQMPELNGFELAAMIREHPRFEKTAIIFVSGIHLSDFDQLKGYAAGAVDYVSVPIIPELLRAKVRVFADLYRKTRQLGRMNEELERRVAERTAQLEVTAQRLRSSEQRRSIALAAGSMGSWDWNADTDELVWDAGQYLICGLDERFRLTTTAIASLLHPEDREATCASAASALKDGRTFQAEFRIIRPSGETRWCIASAVPSRNSQNQYYLLSGVTTDITERKYAEQALARTNEELERRIEDRTREREIVLAQLFEAQKMDTIGHLTGGIAHDFNNLLMVILGSLELVCKRVDDPRALHLINNAIEGAQRGSALTQRLLAFARKQELKPVPIDVANLVDNMKDLLVRAVGATVRITTSFPDSLPAIKIDPQQLEMALLNLAVNARDAMAGGGSLVISAELAHVAPSASGPLVHGDYVCLSLTDTGIGMDEETLLKATEPFFTTKGLGKGTGLGLSMVHGMTGQSGGALEVISSPGNGTTIKMFLPIAEEVPTSIRTDLRDEVPVLIPNLPQLTVLVVDDDYLVRAGTTAMLDDLGYSVIEAGSGKEALLLLGQSTSIDLVIADYAMPEMTGDDLLKSIKERFPNLHTILASGYTELLDVDFGRGCVRLAKPFTQGELATAIWQTVEMQRRHNAMVSSGADMGEPDPGERSA